MGMTLHRQRAGPLVNLRKVRDYCCEGALLIFVQSYLCSCFLDTKEEAKTREGQQLGQCHSASQMVKINVQSPKLHRKPFCINYMVGPQQPSTQKFHSTCTH